MGYEENEYIVFAEITKGLEKYGYTIREARDCLTYLAEHICDEQLVGGGSI